MNTTKVMDRLDETQDPTSPENAAATQGAQMAQGREALIVERDLLAARVLKTKLSGWGYHVRSFVRTGEALDAFRLTPARMVFLGADMAGMTDLCRSLRRMRTAGYTYIIGVGGGSDDLLAVLEAGADEYIKRPINVQELRLRLRNAERLLALDDALFSGGGVDPATGRITRGAFETFLRAILAQIRRSGSKCVLLFVRIPDYRALMERHGFTVAHKAVVDISAQLAGVHRDSDIVAKIRDDEFCLLLQDTEWDVCRPVMERILERTASIWVPVEGRGSVRVPVMLEALNVPPEESDISRLLDDRAMREPCGGNRDRDAAG